jgi:type II secretory pathway pseudopilin PulG
VTTRCESSITFTPEIGSGIRELLVVMIVLLVVALEGFSSSSELQDATASAARSRVILGALESFTTSDGTAGGGLRTGTAR